jgi:hypothetical protein
MKTKLTFLALVAVFGLNGCNSKENAEIPPPDRMSVESLRADIERVDRIDKVTILDRTPYYDPPTVLIEVLGEKPKFLSKYEMVVGGKKFDMKRYYQLRAFSRKPEVIEWMEITLADPPQRP